MLKYTGCLIIIAVCAFSGEYIRQSTSERINAIKSNLDKLKKTVSDYEVFGMNFNCIPEDSEFFTSTDREMVNQIYGINNIDELKDFILQMEKYYLSVKEKNEGIQKNSVIIGVLMGIAIITLVY